MKKIVITGGPCGGKTTVISALGVEFEKEVAVVPEVATMLLEGGFPTPGRDVEWSEEWQEAFQNVILPLQKSVERVIVIKAKKEGKKILICDRGILDGAAYTPGGSDEFCKKFNLNQDDCLNGYDAIVHLESLSVVDPDKYGKAGNSHRFEPLEKAIEIEASVKKVWEKHHRHFVINGNRGIVGKISEVIGMVRFLAS
ncbi:MAG: ATP-binding protein [bacterium]